MEDRDAERGTTLVEAIIAVGLLAGAVVSLAGLSTIAIRTAAIARERSTATILAMQKLEELCSEPASLPLSAADAWAADTPGYVQYLDAYGNPLAGTRGSYVRRWSVTPLAADAGLVAIQVDVAACRNQPGASRCGDSVSHARLASVRSRLAW